MEFPDLKPLFPDLVALADLVAKVLEELETDGIIAVNYEKLFELSKKGGNE